MAVVTSRDVIAAVLVEQNKRSLNGRVCTTAVVSFGRRGGLMVSVLYSGANGPGSGPGRGHCVVFLGKTLYSLGASLHPGV